MKSDFDIKRRCIYGGLCAVTVFVLTGSVNAQEAGESIPVEARAAIADGFFDLAEQKLAGWLDGRSEPADETMAALNLYCRALAGLGRVEDIRKLLKSDGAPSAMPVAGTAFEGYWTTYCDYSDGSYSAVTNNLKGFFQDHSQDKQFAGNALRLQGWALMRLGDTNAGIRCFIEYEDKFGAEDGRAGNLLDLGRALFSVSDYSRAVKYLRMLEEMEGAFPEKAHGLNLLAKSLRSSGAVAQAGEVLEKLASDETVAGDIRAEAWFDFAETAVEAGAVTNAVSACEKGLKLVRDVRLKMRGDVLYGRALIDAGRLEEGIAVLKGQVVKMTDPAWSAELQIEIAREYLNADRNLESVGEFQFYLETFTNTAGLAEAHIGKGWGLFRLQRYAESAGEFQKGFELSEIAGRKEESLYKMADAYFANGQYKLALEAYERFAEEFKDSGYLKSVNFQRAESLLGAGRVEDAEKQYVSIVDTYPDSDIGAEARLKLGQLKFEHKDISGAVIDFEEVMRKFPDTPYYVRALHGRAKTYFSAGDYVKALRDLEEITEKYPASAPAEDAMYEKGLCYHRMGRIEKVHEVFDALLKKHPGSSWAPDVVFWQGEQELNRGNYEKAESIFIAFTENYPGSALIPEALLRAGMAASGRKEYVRAMELFNRLAKDYPNSVRIPDARFAQANALCELGRFPEAILPLDEIINKYPDSMLVIAAWGRKGDAHFVMGAEDAKRYEESIQCYRVVASSSKAPRSMVLQAEYKIGRSLEKLGKVQEALDRYYGRVMVPFLEQKEKGEKHDESSRVWFTRASLGAAEILEAQKDWRRAANVLERLAESGVPGAKAAGERAAKIRSDNWWLFY